MRSPTARSAAYVLLLLGFALRFWASGHARFTGDESHYWWVSRQLATFKEFPVYGPEITGSAAHLPGALYYYLMAIPQLFGASPRLGATAVIIGHLVSAWLLFLLLEKARGERAALIGLAIAMVTPWDVLYSDRIWGSCVVPILGSIAIYAAVRASESGRWQGVLIALCLALPQLHLSAPVLWLACGTIVFLRRPERWDRKAIAISLGVVFVLYLPMLIAEIDRGFTNTRTILSQAGGKESWAKTLWVPLEMAGYAILYGSAELSYHFDRGYWGGYDDLARYGTIAGWSRWWARHGTAIAVLTIGSIVLSAACWIRALASLRRRSLESIVFLGLLAGLGGGVALLFLTRKGYFPHYANVLMPMLIWPLALALDDAWRSKILRIPAFALLAVSLVAMVINVVRYYREVDGLNGLSITVEMVGKAVGEGVPIDLSFEHFNNSLAWNLVAKGVYGKQLVVKRGSVVSYRVRNGRRTDEMIERREHVRAKPAGLVWRASEHWRSIEVAGEKTCVANDQPSCKYGDQPWQELKPDTIEMKKKMEPLLFLHPIAGRRVIARMTVPKASSGTIYYGLSDAAHRSSQVPVEVTLRQGRQTLLEVATEPKPGLVSRAFTLTGTAALELELETTNDGARVFGFDIDLSD